MFLKKSNNTKTNILSYKHNGMSTGTDGVSASFILPCVLCIILTHPKSLSHLQRKERKSFTVCPNLLLSKSHTWKAVTQLSGVSVISLTQYYWWTEQHTEQLSDCSLYWTFMPSKFTEWIVNPLIGQSLIVIKIIK